MYVWRVDEHVKNNSYGKLDDRDKLTQSLSLSTYPNSQVRIVDVRVIAFFFLEVNYVI